MDGTIHNTLQNHLPLLSHQKSHSTKGDDLLTQTVIELYLNLKQRLKQFSSGKITLSDDTSAKNQQIDETAAQVEEEKKRLSQLGNLVVIDYIRSSMDILLNLKIESAMLEQKDQKNQYQADTYINSSRGGHGALSYDIGTDSQRSSQQSIMTLRDGPPQVYEEIIISLEGDVRKHIRIEQQLKLHIESIEFRLDELESDNEKMLKEIQNHQQFNNQFQNEKKIQIEYFEKEISKLKQELRDQESKFQLESRSMKERFQIEKDQLTSEIHKLKQENSQQKNAINISNPSSKSQQSICNLCRQMMSPSRTQNFSLYNINEQIVNRSNSKNKTDLSLDTIDKKFSSIGGASNSTSTNKKILFKRTTIAGGCSCPCQYCQLAHQNTSSNNKGNFTNTQDMSASGISNISNLTQTGIINNNSNNNYIQNQKNLLTNDKKLNNKSNLQQPHLNNLQALNDQNDLLKMQQDINKYLLVEKRQSGSKNRQNASNQPIKLGLSTVAIASSTPDKNMKTNFAILNASLNSGQNRKNKKIVKFVTSNNLIGKKWEQSKQSKFNNTEFKLVQLE
ncbi:UNKNOWN [Stylonychia lemnae]|uniref:Uncharacterized protein n=1 Tax=Stylonychia lemnae TaxID=5949 RepID=A0A077ZQU5_STYLE|nr:UNKNOWN [Stylonychia lemnae]|eukprot:CDW71760.1 UNKNOWN [Stylonychia lemnae]